MMQLNLTTDYAIRLILYLATVNRMASSQEIAQAMNIPPKYITTIVGKLKKAELVKTIQGPRGGYTLNCVPEKTTLNDIISIMEGGIQFRGCTSNTNYILQKMPMRNLTSFYDNIHLLIEDALKNITIADLIMKK